MIAKYNFSVLSCLDADGTICPETITELIRSPFLRCKKNSLLRELQTRPNSHLPAGDIPKDQNKRVQIRAPTPSSINSEQAQTYTNSYPLVEDTPAEDLLAAGGCKFG